jgi:DNA-binding MarR family transcriptional regulator
MRARMDVAGFPDFRPTDSWMLRLLVRRPWAIGQLGEAMGITRQAARQLADGLAERGYATLGSDPADGRRTLVDLTRRGRAYARAVLDAQEALNDALRRRVSAADLVAARRVLRAVFPADAKR